MNDAILISLILFPVVTFTTVWIYWKTPLSHKRHALAGIGAVVLGMMSIPIHNAIGIMSYGWVLIPLGITLYLLGNFGPPER